MRVDQLQSRYKKIMMKSDIRTYVVEPLNKGYSGTKEVLAFLRRLKCIRIIGTSFSTEFFILSFLLSPLFMSPEVTSTIYK